jgi:hypothetical protein
MTSIITTNVDFTARERLSLRGACTAVLRGEAASQAPDIERVRLCLETLERLESTRATLRTDEE